MLASLLRLVQPQSHISTADASYPNLQLSRPPDHSMDEFLREAKRLFETPLDASNLYAMSEQLQQEFRCKLVSSNICMLPSFHHTLPDGNEQGTFLALDVGGSTFRIALVNLSRKESDQDGMDIKRMKAFAIDSTVRALKGQAFFLPGWRNASKKCWRQTNTSLTAHLSLYPWRWHGPSQSSKRQHVPARYWRWARDSVRHTVSRVRICASLS